MQRSIEWAAGLFEGEGCICNSISTYENGKYRYLDTAFRLVMTDEDVVRDFADTLDLKVTGPYQNKTGIKPYWVVCTKAKQTVRRCLLQLLPHLGSRRACKALDALDIIECKLSPEEFFKTT